MCSGAAAANPKDRSEFPKPLTDDSMRAADVVITMGCGDPGKRYEDWELTDPAGHSLEQVRPIRDEIEGRVRDLLATLAPEGTAAPQ